MFFVNDNRYIYILQHTDILVWWAVPKYVVGQSEVEASKDERVLFDFYYACAGSSVYRNLQDASNDKQVLKTELPVCVGLEVKFSLFLCVCEWEECTYALLHVFVFDAMTSVQHLRY